MRLDKTVLYKFDEDYEDFDNTLVPCLDNNDCERLTTMSKNAHEYLVYKCFACEKTLIKRADTVAHKNKNARCPFCRWSNDKEELLHNILYSTIAEMHDKPFDVLKIEKWFNIDGRRCRADAVLELGDRKLIIELDGSSHFMDKKTKETDILKMRESRAKGWSVMRILLLFDANFSEATYDLVRRFVTSFMSGGERFEVFLNDHDNLLRNKFLNI